MKKIKNNTFLKYIFSAGISFGLDLAIFTILNWIFKIPLGSYSILLATILARCISSLINYHLNRNTVFKHENDNSKIDKKSFIKYIILVIVQMFVSSIAVFSIYKLTRLNETFIKVPVDCILFLINYIIQKLFIFNNEKKRFNIPTKYNKALIWFFTIFSSIGLLIELNPQSIITYTRHESGTLIAAIVGTAIYFLYKKQMFKNKKRTPFVILSIIFSLLLIFGYSFDTTDSAYLVYGNIAFIAISIIKLIGLFPLIYTILNTIYDYLINLKIGNLKNNKINNFFNNHPIKFTIIILFICYLPYIIAYYPAIMGYDPANQIKEVMGIHNRYMDSVILLDENVTITSFNPVIHTLLLGSCFKLGVAINNVNLGLFLYSIIQISFQLGVLAYSIYFLKQEKVPNKLLYIIIAIYAFVPIFPFYALSTNKDTFFTLLIMLYIIKLYELIKYKFTKKQIIEMTLICIVLFLSRNNGIYTIMLSLPFCLMLKDKRKPVFIIILITLISYNCYNKVLLPYFKVTPTSIRETLSIPFQQTAALIKYKENIIEEKDKKIISSILDYEIIKNSYNPELSDKVKNTFNRYYKDEDLKSYFNVWFKYLIKEPIIYIDATINNIYGYFYPNTVRWFLYCEYNEKLKEAGFDYHFNNLSISRLILAGYGNAFQYIPILGLFVNIGFNVWIYMFLVCALIINKNKKMILILLPALSLILVCIASPANAYFRYAMPYIMTLPLILGLLYQNRKNDKN